MESTIRLRCTRPEVPSFFSVKHRSILIGTMLMFLFIAVATILVSTTIAEPGDRQAQPTSHGIGYSHGFHKPLHDGDSKSICNKYTDSILGSNTPTNQRLLMTLFVNTALAGNYTTPNTGVAVNGIMWPGKWEGQEVNLMPWFNGKLASSNPCPNDCGQGVSVNWLDGGGPDALRQNLTSFEQGTNQLSVFNRSPLSLNR
jgi:hypothetical protein